MIQKQAVSSFSRTENLIRQSERKAGKSVSGKKQNKKKLKYNSREISVLLLNAGNSQSAAAVLIMARSRLADVRSAAAMGQYDKTEVMNAIRHADKMVSIAKQKMDNLKGEETEKRLCDREKKALDKAGSRRKRSATKLQLQLKRQQMELKRRSRKHRNEERAKIEEANHSYDIASGRSNREIPMMNASERLILSELQKLEMKERKEKENNSVRGEAGSTDGIGNVVDVSVSGEMDAEVAASSADIDISI